MKVFFIIASLTISGLWFTPDQQGQRLYNRGEFIRAAEAFQDPEWEGISWYRAGEFKKAAETFARWDSPEATYNQGNAWLMSGQYDKAIACYDRALASRKDWQEAMDNRAIAVARAKALDIPGGDMTGGMLGADEIVIGDMTSSDGESVEVTGGDQLSESEIQALWLRRVQTNPADFLRSKFSFQEANRNREVKP